MASRGQVKAVAWLKRGGELTADTAAGALQLVVDNPVDFDEDGGTLELNGAQLDYSLVDMDSGTITLTVATAALANAGDRVNVVAAGVIAIDYTAFVSLGDGDEIEVPIPYEQRDLWVEGEYANPIMVDLSDDLEQILAVPGMTPVRDGSFINPSTLPTPAPPALTDGNPPSSSPTPTVTGGIGSIFVRWVPPANHDALTYDLHVSPTTGFTPDATTLAVAGTAATSATIRALPTGVGTPPDTTLHYGQPYYFRVQAKDADGPGPMGAESPPGYTVQVTGPDVAAESITGDKIAGNSITGDLLAGEVILGSTISTGQMDETGNIVGARIDLGPDGMTGYAADGHQVMNFPTDPSDDAYVEAHLHILSADVDDNLTLFGNNNEIAASSSLILGAGVSAPSTPPTLLQTWDFLQLDVTTKVNPSGGLGNFALDPTQVTSIVWDTTWNVWQVFQQRSNGFRLWRFDATGALSSSGGANASDWVGSYDNVSGSRGGWVFLWSDGNWWVWDTVVGGGRYGILPSSWIINGNQNPHLGFDEAAQQFMLIQNPTGSTPKTQQVRRFHTVPYVGGNVQNAVSDGVTTLPSGMGRGYPITGSYYGAGDFGGNRYVICPASNTQIQVASASTIYNGAANYAYWTANGLPYGFAWDGANFWTLDGSGKLQKYSSWTWPNEPSTTWVGMSAYDSDPTGGTHETPVGTMASLNAVRRAKLSITVPKTLDTGASDDPDQWRIYWGRLASGTGTPPTASQLHLVTGLGNPATPSSTVMTADSTGAVPPGGVYGQAGATNTFPAGNPAKLLAGDGSLIADATCHGNLGMAGEIRMYGGTTAPAGWLLCQGQSLTRAAYPALFAVIGTLFGVGTDSPTGTTFAVPDMRMRFPLGLNPGTTTPNYSTVGGTEGSAPDQSNGGREGRFQHTHAHGPGSLSNSTTDLNQATNTQTGGSANRIQQATHSHNLSGQTDSSGVGGAATSNLSVHAYTTLNFIIRT
jgi:microcystin-dependent protein